MTSSRVVDHDLDRPQVQAQRCVEPSGTNTACGLAYFNFTSQKVRFGRLEPSRTLQVSLVPDLRPFQAGGHREAVIPVPIPNTEVKRLIAEGSAGPARARVGRRRPFFFCTVVALLPEFSTLIPDFRCLLASIAVLALPCRVNMRLVSPQPHLPVARRAISASLRPLGIHEYAFGSQSCINRLDARRPFG